GIFQALTMSGCAFALISSARQNTQDGRNHSSKFAAGLNLISEIGDKLAPAFVGLAITALGIEHFIFSETPKPQVPVWIPGTVAGNYLSGALLMVCGVGMCMPQTRRSSAKFLAVLVLGSLLIFHLPVILHTPGFESDWTKTLVITGGAILLARRP